MDSVNAAELSAIIEEIMGRQHKTHADLLHLKYVLAKLAEMEIQRLIRLNQQ
jgi:hypothetical protein